MPILAGKGLVPSTPTAPQTTGKGRSGGGNAPFGRPGKARPRAARAPVTLPARNEWVTWPTDEFGCYVIPPGFPLGRYSYNEWQVYWGVPHQIVEQAMAMRAAHAAALRQRGGGPHPCRYNDMGL